MYITPPDCTLVIDSGWCGVQEERTAVTAQEGAHLPLDCLRLDAPQQPSLWKEQYKVKPLIPGSFQQKEAKPLGNLLKAIDGLSLP